MKETKYKQAYIPSISTDKTIKDGKKFIKEYYTQNLQGKCVVNQHLGIKIYFTSVGKAELTHGRALYGKKVVIVKCLSELLKVAEYNNFGIRKDSDPPSFFGYLNFKAKVEIDGKIENVRINVLMKKDGKAYYSHEVNKKK